MSSGWYYHQAGTTQGPIDLADLRGRILNGRLDRATLVWTEGMADWQAAGEVSALTPGPPPLPGGTRSPASDTPPVILPNPGRYAAPAHRSAASGYDDRPPSQQGATTGPEGLHAQAPARGLYAQAPARSFGEAISVCFGKYATFSGRASRSEYWFFYLFCFLVNLGASVLDLASAGIASVLAMLVLILPSLASLVRRLHDTGRSGWRWLGWPALGMIGVAIVGGLMAAGQSRPEAGAVVLLAMAGIGLFIWALALVVVLCFKGDPGPNHYG